MTRNTRATLWWLGIIGFFILMLYQLRVILLPFVIAMMAAYLLDPVVDRLQRLRLSRGLATMVVTVVFFTLVALLAIALFPLVSEQLAGLISSIPHVVEQATAFYNSKVENLLAAVPDSQISTVKGAFGNFTDMATSMLTGFAGGLFTSGASVLNVVALLLLTPVVSFYLLKDWDHILDVIDELLPRKHAKTVRAQANEIDRTISGFLRGQVLVCAVLAVYYAVALTIVGVPFGLLVGGLTGALTIIPYVGWCSSFLLALALAYTHGDPAHHMLIGVVGIYLVGQVIESYFLTPKLVGDRVGLHPLWLIFGMLAGGVLLGFVGVLLAVPITAVIGVLTRFTVERYRHSSLYKG